MNFVSSEALVMQSYVVKTCHDTFCAPYIGYGVGISLIQWKRNREQFDNSMPDWMRPMSPAELEREAMDYEFNAQYDRYDSWGDRDFQDEFDDRNQY